MKGGNGRPGRHGRRLRNSHFPIPDKPSGRFRVIRPIVVPTGPRATGPYPSQGWSLPRLCHHERPRIDPMMITAPVSVHTSGTSPNTMSPQITANATCR